MEPSLSMSKGTATSALHLSELFVLLFGLLLVVGLIGELAKSDKWKAHLRLFEILVIVGVAGELIGDGGIFAFSERLQTISDAEVARLNKESAQLREKASEADERTSRNEKDAAQLRQVAEEERLARVRIEERLNWRRLAKRQQDSMKAALRRVAAPPSGAIRVVDVFGSTESQSFADEISSVLNSAGWVVPSKMRATAQFDPLPVGVSLLIGDDAGVFGIASVLANALTEAHVAWDGQIKKSQQVKSGMVHIRVGIK